MSHIGKTKMLALDQDLYFWPGMVKDIKKLAWACPECKKRRILKPASPYMQTLDAAYLLQKLSTDLAQLAGKHYLVVVYCYSDGLNSLSSDV